MSDEIYASTADDAEVSSAIQPVPMPRIPDKPMPRIENRFLFVDIAAQRTKQLRRGALPRLEPLRPNPETGERPEVVSRLERVAMEEVEQGLIVYEMIDGDDAEATS
ncbi:MAG: DNA-directed RNA polymerase subunit omega [Acidobacteriota bacterium]|nr:DNA-directed RNA polymerase subunit omega [Acidobacteriota bacterium]